jgi:hypothetical protein
MKNMKTFTTPFIVCSLFSFFLSAGLASAINNEEQNNAVIKNFNDKKLQLTRFDRLAAAIDAHDGEIALFDGVYYLYGTSYDCGYEWGVADAPFCGFKVYTSKDLMHWTDEGFLFDATTEIWQTRCNGKTYGCYRPHVIYNEKTNKYVLWINVYDNRNGFRVFTGDHPKGPFTEIQEPTVAVNNNAPIAGTNNGDHDTFVDDDGKAYLAYTDWRTGGSLIIEELNENYTSGTGRHIKAVTSGKTEAPCLMKRHDKYYILYSDPNCGYCGGTGTSYKTAPTPLGPWTAGSKISDNSCGGQPAFASVFKLEGDTIFLYGSDLWNNSAKNEALANYFWAPLSFASDGSINPIDCYENYILPVEQEDAPVIVPENMDNFSGVEGFTTYNDITGNYQRGQSFVATRKGYLTAVSFTSSKSGRPDSGLTIEIYKANDDYKPTGNALSSETIHQDSIGWSPKFVTVHPNIPVEEGVRYTMIVKSESGRYGLQYNDNAPYAGGGAIYSNNKGSSYSKEANRTLMFQTVVEPDLQNNVQKYKLSDFFLESSVVKQELNITLANLNQCSEVKIVDMLGKIVISQQVAKSNTQNIFINMSALTNGMYVVKLENDGICLGVAKVLKI